MKPSEDETQLWVALNKAQRRIYGAMDSALKCKGLPPLRWYDVLWELERAKECGLRPFEMESKLIFLQSNLSRLLHRMIGVGLVEEFTFENDKRGKVLRITDKGRDVRKQMWGIYGPLIHKHMSVAADQNDVKSAITLLNDLSK